MGSVGKISRIGNTSGRAKGTHLLAWNDPDVWVVWDRMQTDFFVECYVISSSRDIARMAKFLVDAVDLGSTAR